jgi:flagellar biosynthesis protein FlhF
MRVVPFIADSAAEAVAQIREQLGPNAVVLNVRRLPAAGLSRIWSPSKIEVMACVPDALPPAPVAPAADRVMELRREIESIRQSKATPPFVVDPPSRTPQELLGEPPRSMVLARNGWRVGSMLEAVGVLPMYAERVQELIQGQSGERVPRNVSEELTKLRETVSQIWKTDQVVVPAAARGVHIFIGPPGVGKTTVLCKWLAQSSLLSGTPSRVLRLDSHVANTAESLSIYGEILGVTVERFIPQGFVVSDREMVFVDLPGTPGQDEAAMGELARLLSALPSPQVHLVLNAAYESQTLLQQVRAYSRIVLKDLVITHLDEELRLGKLLNLVLGTNYTVAYLTGGQNVPGEFRVADARAFVERVFR